MSKETRETITITRRDVNGDIRMATTADGEIQYSKCGIDPVMKDLVTGMRIEYDSALWGRALGLVEAIDAYEDTVDNSIPR